MMKRLFYLLCAVSLLFGSQMNVIANSSQEQSQAAQTMDIKDFVRQTFIHGVPYEEAGKYGSDAVSTLLEMLGDTAEEAHWSNIVVTLCIIGDEKAVDPILAFIGEDVQGELSPSHYTAKTSAIMALGYLINKNGNKEALDYLKECLKPNVWADRKLAWTSPYQASVDDRNVQLSTMAILGLALSGNAEAADALRSLKEPATTAMAREFQSQVSGVVDEALNAYDAIAKDGLAEYYRKAKQEE